MVAGLLGTVAALVASPPAAGADATARQIAAALQRDAVFVDESAADLLSGAEAARLRARIAERDRGRVQLVVVSKERSARTGGLSTLANAVDQAAGQGRRGALVVTDSAGFHMVTSFANPEPTTAALRAAVSGYQGDRLAGALMAAVDAIAEVEPGRSADLAERVGQGRAGPPGGTTVTAKDVSGSVSVALIVVAVALALPLLLLAGGMLLRWRRGRTRATDQRTIALKDARTALGALGDDITAMDLDTEMPGASPDGRADYDRAVDLYQRASRALDDRDLGDVELADVQRSLQEGRARIDAARAAFGG